MWCISLKWPHFLVAVVATVRPSHTPDDLGDFVFVPAQVRENLKRQFLISSSSEEDEDGENNSEGDAGDGNGDDDGSGGDDGAVATVEVSPTDVE